MRGILASEASGFVVANASRWPTTMPFSFLDVFGFRFAFATVGKAALNRGRRCVRRDAGSCARVGAYGCRGLARGRVPREFWAVSQETGADFAMGPGLLCGSQRESFAVGFSDLGKRRRAAAFRAGSACETAQKSQAGLACVEGGASWYALRSCRRWSALAHEQALEAHRRAGYKPQARMVARRVRPRLPDGRQRQGEGQAGLLPVLFGEEEAREADKARLALGPSAREERGEAGRRLLPIGVILRILDRTAMRGGYEGLHRFR